MNLVISHGDNGGFALSREGGSDRRDGRGLCCGDSPHFPQGGGSVYTKHHNNDKARSEPWGWREEGEGGRNRGKTIPTTFHTYNSRIQTINERSMTAACLQLRLPRGILMKALFYTYITTYLKLVPSCAEQTTVQRIYQDLFSSLLPKLINYNILAISVDLTCGAYTSLNFYFLPLDVFINFYA